MKKRWLVFVVIGGLLLTACSADTPDGPDPAGKPANDTAPATESRTDTEVAMDLSREVERIVDHSLEMEGVDFPCVEELFYEDENHAYFFGYPISPYVTVYYTDGSEENVKDALEKGHMQISELDRWSIRYFAEAKWVERIVDLTKNGEIATDDALEGFYRDDENLYLFSSIKSQYVIVYYKDGSEQSVKDALAEGRVKISDLDWFGIDYDKSPLQ